MGTQMMCGLVNLPKPLTKFSIYNKTVGSVVEDIAQETMQEAVEAVSVNDSVNKRDLTVGLDGSWQKRGHQSLNGVVTATSGDTAKVIDAVILSKYCRCPDRIKNKHDESCQANYSGSSGGMKIEGVKKMFERSVAWYKARYVNFLGDGDCKSFKTIEELKPYGNYIEVKKLECIGHIQ